MKIPLRLLLVEDSEDDAQLVLEELERGGFEPAIERVDTAVALETALRRQAWDIVISDYRLPEFSGPAALRLVRASGVDLPFIIVSGTVGEDTAVEMLKAGADDYLLKDRLGRLGSAVSHELESRRLRAEHGRAQGQLRLLNTALDTAANGVLITDRDGRILWVNPAFSALTGYSATEAVGQTPRLLKSGQHDTGFYELFWKTIAGGRTWRGEFTNRRKDGRFYHDEHTVTPVLDAGGRVTHFIGIMHDVTARKAAEGELRDSEARMRLAVAASNIGFWDWNVLTNQVYFSPEWKGQLGYADAEFPNRFEEWESRLHPDDRTPTLARLREFLEGRATEYAVEFRLRHRDGSHRWIFTEASITRDATGRPLRMVGCHLDFTERKLAEAALQESERKYRLMVDNMAECVVVLDLGLRNVFASPSVVKIYGYTPDEFVALPLERVMSPEAFRQAKQAFAEEMALEASGTADPGRTRLMESLEYRRDGSPVWIENTLSFIRDAAGRPAQILCVAKDITERRQSLLALKESRHLLERAQVVGHIGSWVSEAGPPARLDWSAETFRIFGVTPGQFDGRPESFSGLVHPEDREAVSRAAQAALSGGPAYDLEHRIVRPDGQVRWVHEQADLEHDRSGRPQRMIGVVQDITDRKQLEEQLRQAQKMEAIGQLAGGIAHDFNNILGAILGNAELIKLLPPGSPEAIECLDDILTGSRRAGDLVGQILAFSRRQESRRLPIQLHPVVREVLKLLRATVPANVEFRAQVASTPTVLADPSEIHQMIMNLCTNAWHAMHGRAGLIVVELAETELTEDFARLHPDLRPGRYVRLSVADNGCGMDAATVGRIFEPFFTTKPVGTGTGLGLSVVHGIMKNHEGGIVVRSQPGEGSTFQLHFPPFAADPVPASVPSAPVPRGAGQQILFVDDEEPLARMGSRVLERLGYRVAKFTSPTEALEAFRAQPGAFDLIVVDYNMPGMNGADFCAQVLVTRPDQRLVLTTGYSATLSAAAARDLGCRELMLKPYDFHSLGETVHRALHGNVAQP